MDAYENIMFPYEDIKVPHEVNTFPYEDSMFPYEDAYGTYVLCEIHMYLISDIRMNHAMYVLLIMHVSRTCDNYMIQIFNT